MTIRTGLKANRAGMLEKLLEVERDDPAKYLEGFIEFLGQSEVKPGRKKKEEVRSFDFTKLLQTRWECGSGMWLFGEPCGLVCHVSMRQRPEARMCFDPSNMYCGRTAGTSTSMNVILQPCAWPDYLEYYTRNAPSWERALTDVHKGCCRPKSDGCVVSR